MPCVRDPFADIADHVVKPESVASIGADRHEFTFADAETEFVVKIIRIICGHVRTVRENGAATRAAGVFPLGLTG
jgi:hypothetical protein